MRRVENGDFVKVSYTGRLESGEVFDQTSGNARLEVEVGAGSVIRGFEEALLGMAVKEKKTIRLSPEEAYGDRDERLHREILRSNFPPDYEPQPGEVVAFTTPAGEQLPAMVTEVRKDSVVIDFNHPLAGEVLTFDLEVAEINDRPDPSHTGCGAGCDCGS